ncbi:Protein kinase domain-containing protein [Plasmodiophora brassicae]
MGAVNSSFPYKLGDLRGTHLGWALHDGSRKSDNEEVSVFVFDKKSSSPQMIHNATRCVMRLKTLRYPHILRFIDSTEVPENIFIVTERVSPVVIGSNGFDGDPRMIPLGLYQIASAVSFINNDCKMSHSALSSYSVFVTRSGDWKLGGMDIVSDADGLRTLDQYSLKAYLPSGYIPPDIAKSSGSLASLPVHAIDSWCLGCLIFELFNGVLSQPQQLGNTINIPASLIQHYKRLLATASVNRLQASQLLATSKYFDNDIVKTVDFLDQLAIKNASEKEVFFRDIQDRLESLPESLSRYRVLPSLLTALEYGGVAASASRVLTATLSIGAKLPVDEFVSVVQPCLVKQFASNDRAVRAALLKALPDYIMHVSDAVVNDALWPHIVTGFTDTEPRLREATVKSLLYILPKLRDKTIQISAMPVISRMQRDPVAGIRTNTVIAVGKVVPYLSATSQARILAPTIALALRDPFVPSREAALSALQATSNLFKLEDLVKSIIPSICPLMIDPALSVRTQARQTIRSLVDQIEELSSGMGDAAAESQGRAGKSEGGAPQVAMPTDLAGASALAGKLTGWAVSSISSKLLSAAGEGGNSSAKRSSVSSTQSVPSSKAGPSSTATYQPPRASAPAITESIPISDDWDDGAHDQLTAALSLTSKRDPSDAGLSLYSIPDMNPPAASSGADDIFGHLSLQPSAPATAAGWDDDWLSDNFALQPLSPPTTTTTAAASLPPPLSLSGQQSTGRTSAPVSAHRPQPADPKRAPATSASARRNAPPMKLGGAGRGNASAQTKFEEDFFNNW